MCSPVSGASCASFITTVLPKISAGDNFQSGIAAGKFHGVIRPTTPSGRRKVYTELPLADCSNSSPLERNASPA